MTIILDSADPEWIKSQAYFYEKGDMAKVVECDATLQLPSVDARVQNAMYCLINDGIIKHKYDHAWIMHLIDEGGIKEIEPFYSEKSYINYMHELGINGVPGVSTLNQYYNTVSGCFPDWTFSDTKDNDERLRRVNIGNRFRVAFVKGLKW
jgi:hypothetical protein